MGANCSTDNEVPVDVVKPVDSLDATAKKVGRTKGEATEGGRNNRNRNQGPRGQGNQGEQTVLEGAPQNYSARRRGSVSAEVASVELGKTYIKKVIPKSEEAEARIRASIKSSFLFTDLDEEQMEDIILSMQEKKTAAGDVIINEGEDGDNFYIIEKGNYEASKDQEVKFTYEGKGAFGELALMYNCPRAATVKSITDGVLWAVDRPTFRSIIVVSMAQKRQKYEAILEKMDMFSGLSVENRAVIADCLSAEVFQAGEYILKEGQTLESDAKFYVVEKGTIECFKSFGQEKKVVKVIEPGGFFGEVALVSKLPRQADCIAKTDVRVLSMGRDAFVRLMGPVEKILAEKIEEYKEVNEKIQNSV